MPLRSPSTRPEIRSLFWLALLAACGNYHFPGGSSAGSGTVTGRVLAQQDGRAHFGKHALSYCGSHEGAKLLWRSIANKRADICQPLYSQPTVEGAVDAEIEEEAFEGQRRNGCGPELNPSDSSFFKSRVRWHPGIPVETPM